MRFKLDENLPQDLAVELANSGHDVDTVLQENLGGQADRTVVQAATQEDRMLLTLDRGIGDIRLYPPGSHPGIVVLRPASQDPGSLLQLVDRFLKQGAQQLTGAIMIVEEDRVRVRRAGMKLEDDSAKPGGRDSL